MLTILHGNNIVSSRTALTDLLNTRPNSKVLKLEAKNLNPETISQSLESQSLFDHNQIVTIENLFSLPQSKAKNQLIEILLNNLNKNIYVWEKKSLTPSLKKKFSNNKNISLKEFKLPAIIFKLLDSLFPKNTTAILTLYYQSINSTPSQLVFYMISRRLSQLIQAKDDHKSLKGAPWQISNIISQAKKFKLNHLLQLHSSLLNLDKSIKTGQNPLSLTTQLDLLILKI